MSHIRPDITYFVGIVSQFMHDPREEHLQVINNILHYLKATLRKGIMFWNSCGVTLEVYSDADYISSPIDKRSISDYCTFLG